jgi:hypothetical protein
MSQAIELHQTLLIRGEPDWEVSAHPPKAGGPYDSHNGFATVRPKYTEENSLKSFAIYFHTSKQAAALAWAIFRAGDALAEFERDAQGLRMPDPAHEAAVKAAQNAVPWPVPDGTDTTGWTDSQKLGEQPPPGWVEPSETGPDDFPAPKPKTCNLCCEPVKPGYSHCAKCLSAVPF